MIFTTEKFKKEYSTLDEAYKQKILNIVIEIDSLEKSQIPDYLNSLYLGDSKSKWSGIKKTLYHLYPQGKGSQHRLFYCYARDLDNNELVVKSKLFSDDVIFIDYIKLHDHEDKAAKNYNKENIDFLYEFKIPVSNHVDNNSLSLPIFWFRLTEDQDNVLKIEQPASIKGSAGTGKTFISYELFKHWIIDNSNIKILYLTYTDRLLEKTRKTLILDGVDIKSKNISIFKFSDLLSANVNFNVVNEHTARTIIKNILIDLNKYNANFSNDIIFNDYFIYSYIRGIMKGRFQEVQEISLDTNEFDAYIKELDLGEFLSKARNVLMNYLKENYLNTNTLSKDIIPKIVYGNNNPKKLSKHLLELFDYEVIQNINKCRKTTHKYDFIDEKSIIKELKKDGFNDGEIKTLVEIEKRYNKKLQENKFIDDNDYAKLILNLKVDEDDKYDGIIIDEVQDLTEIQIKAITTLLNKDSENISFFGDPNQTINPTVYHYGRFNSFLWQISKNMNQKVLKRTHRSGQNLLDYINHLVELRKIFKLTSNTEDLEKEESARLKYDDGHYACLIENNNVIDVVLESFKNAIDSYLIVDNHKTRNDVIERIKQIDGDEYDHSIEEQIITVQESKGLESTNIIMYNIITDNLNIFNNLMSSNNKVASMTFNKFYVSVTRARNSVIICETGLGDFPNIKSTMFYMDGKKIPEEITEDDVEDYLEITSDPEKFYDQAESLLENHDYEKAARKSNIALRHLLNQFDKDDDFVSYIPAEIFNSDSYQELIKISSNLSDQNIEEFSSLYLKLVEEVETFSDYKDVVKLIVSRYDILKNSLRIRKIYNLRQQFSSNQELWNDEDKLLMHEDFILLDNYDSAIMVLESVDSAIRNEYINVVNYIFGNISFEKIKDSFDKITFHNDSIYESIIEREIDHIFNHRIQDKLNELRGLINETIS